MSFLVQLLSAENFIAAGIEYERPSTPDCHDEPPGLLQTSHGQPILLCDCYPYGHRDCHYQCLGHPPRFVAAVASFPAQLGPEPC
jgi:hypothetical protein